jgi:hypothetical protein
MLFIFLSRQSPVSKGFEYFFKEEHARRRDEVVDINADEAANHQRTKAFKRAGAAVTTPQSLVPCLFMLWWRRRKWEAMLAERESEFESSLRVLDRHYLVGFFLPAIGERRGLTGGYLIKAMHGFGQVGHHLFVFVECITMAKVNGERRNSCTANRFEPLISRPTLFLLPFLLLLLHER